MAYTVRLRKDKFVAAALSFGYLSVYSMAKAMKVQRSTVKRVLDGELQPGSVFIASALTAFDVEFDQVFEVVKDTGDSQDPGLPT